jgi:hypothetical protein
MGRFLTPDPYKAGKGSGDPANPESWNRYAYVTNDPVNLRDPRGLQQEDITFSVTVTVTASPDPDDGIDWDWIMRTQYGFSLPSSQVTVSGGAGPLGPLTAGIMRNRRYDGLTLAAQILATNSNCDSLCGLTGAAGNASPRDPREVLAQISNSYEFGAISSPPVRSPVLQQQGPAAERYQ